MVQSWLRQWWLNTVRARTRRPARRGSRVPPSGTRLLLEALEDRLAPATLIVNSVADNITDTSHLTLRDSITLVNNDGNPSSLGQSSMPSGWQSQITGTFGDDDTIEFSSALTGQTITLGGTELGITANVTIAGLGANNLAISGDNESADIGVGVGAQVSIANVTVQDGYGGGIGNAGTLTLSDSIVTGNYAPAFGDNIAGYAGGIYNSGTLTVINSTISDNTAENPGNDAFGGGIFSSGTLTVSNSTFAGNSTSTVYDNSPSAGGGIAAGSGGGIYVAGGTATVTNATFSGNSAGYGGAMSFGSGTMAVSNCTFTGNSAGTGQGAAISNGDPFAGHGGTLTISNCTFLENLAGGAIYNKRGPAGPVTVDNCTFVGNLDGGISNGYGGTMTVYDCTLVGNEGGGILNEGTLTVTNSTLAGNAAIGSDDGGVGGGIATVAGGSTTLNNTIVADNTGGDLYVTSEGSTITSTLTGAYDLIGDGSYLSSLSDSAQANPLLAPLGNYGGPTQTMPLLPGSPAIDAGSVALAVDAHGNPLTTDQRGLPRIVGGAVDIGACESQGYTLTQTGANQSTTEDTVFADPLTVTVTANNCLDPIDGGVVTFTAPSSGASVTPAATTVTLSGGSAALTATANSIVGSYTVTTAVAGAGNSVSFSLTNTALTDPPAAITVASGDGQSTTLNTVFASPLVVTVTDAAGNPLPGYWVTFTGPDTGAGPWFYDGDTAFTNAQGQASFDPAGNNTLGTYTISASVAGVSTQVRFSLTNTEYSGEPAGTLVVNSAADSISPSNLLTLREAILLVDDGGNSLTALGRPLTVAEASQIGPFGDNETIQLDASLTGQTINLGGSALEISASVTIAGPGPGNLAISGDDQSRLFTIDSGTQVGITGLTLEDGDVDNFLTGADADGGGIDNAGTLALSNCALNANVTNTRGISYGGGVYNTGTLAVSNCTFVGNVSAPNNGGLGGAIYNDGTLTISNSAFSGNSAGDGGAIVNALGGVLTVNNSTLSNNICGLANGGANGGGAGGAISNAGTLTLTDSTISNNNSDPLPRTAGIEFYDPFSAGGGGGIDNGGTLSITDSTISGNSAGYQGSGGGIYNTGTLTLNGATLSGNLAGGPQSGPSVYGYGYEKSGGGGVWNRGGTLTITDSTCSNNSGGKQSGGALYVLGGTVALSNSTISGNSDNTYNGGDVYNAGTLMVFDCTIYQNLEGGIYNGGALTVVSTTFSDNSNIFDGGGIFNAGTCTVVDSTFLYNSTKYDGGAIANESKLTVTNSTFWGNSGGGIDDLGDGSATLNNSIVADSTSGGDLYGNAFTGGYDLIGDGSNLSSLTNSLQGNPLLAPPGNYGGPTQTMPPLPGSPAIDAGSNGLAVDGSGNPLTTDQRGLPRIVGSAVDIGACESQGYTVALISGGGQSATVGTAFADPLMVQLSPLSASDPIQGGQLTFAGPATGASVIPASTVFTLGADGEASLAVAANTTAGAYQVSAVAAGAVAPAEFSLINVPGVPDHLSFAVQPNDTAVGDLLNPAVVVKIVDKYGNVITSDNNDQLSLSVASGPGNFTSGSTTTVTVSGGVATFNNLRLDAIGTYTLAVSDTGGLPGPNSSSFAVVQPVAHALGFIVQPSDTTAGVAILPAVEVQVLDQFGQIFSEDNSDQVTLTVASGPGGFTSGSTTTVTVSGGIATFSDLVLDTAGSYTLGASATGGITGPVSAGFTVVPAAPAYLAFGAQPTSTTAGVALDPPVTVNVFDQFNNLATNDSTDQVTLAVVSGPGGFTGGSTTTLTVSGGVATFSNLVLDTAGSYTLAESGSGGLSGPASASFTVSPAAANHLVFGVQPSGTTAGVAISPAVTVQVFDQFGNLASNDNSDKVTLTVASGPGGFTSGSTTTLTVSGGVATFSNLVLDTAGSYTLGESATGGLSGPASAGFAVSPAAANHLAFGVPPSATTAGVAISPAVTVQVFDRFGNLATNDNSDQVTLTVASGPGGFAGGSTTTVTVSGGMATFSNLVLDTAGSYTLGESASGGLSGPNSTGFTVSPAAADHLAFGVPPRSTTAGVTISPVVTVKVFDQFNNLLTNDNSDQVTLAVASGPGGFTSGSTTTVTVSGGVATFSNLVLDTAGSYTLGASGSGGLSGPNSAGFTVSPAAANHLVFGVPPGSAVAGAAISPAVQVQVLDQFGNLATNDNSDQVTLAVASGPGSFAVGSTITVTVSGGGATFSNLVLDTAGSYTLGDSGSGGLSGPSSAGFTVSPAAANRLAFGVPPSGTTAGVALSPAVTVKVFDRFDNFVSNDNTDQVTLSVASGPGDFAGGSTNTVTVSGGVATFSNLVLDTAGSYTLGESASGGITGPNSAGFTVVPAAANHLAFGIQPSGTTAGVAIKPAVTVKAFDQFGNFASNDNSDKVTLAVASGRGGFASGSTTSVTVSGGVATFSNLVLDTAGSYTLADSVSGGVTGPASASFTVVPAAANHLAFGVQPSGTVAGVAFSLAVEVVDKYSNVVTGDNSGKVTLKVASGPGGFAGGSAAPATVSGGVATFSNLVLDTAGSYTLGESGSSGLTGPNSASFTVVPAAASHLTFGVQPGKSVAGVAINPAVTVKAFDPFGNLATNDNSDQVTLAVASGPAGFTSGSTTSVTVSGGVATFSNLVLDTAGSYTLGESATGGLTGPNSAGFTVSPAAANHLAFGIQPSGTTAGVAIKPAVTVKVFDQFGNLVTGDTSNVTVAIGTNPGGGNLSGTTTVAAVGGVATFSTLSINKTGTGYTLSASDSQLGAGTSGAFAITPAASNHLGFLQQPTNAVAGVPISPAVTVQVLDRFNNVVVGDNSDKVTLKVASGPGSFASGSTTTATASGGIATFGNLVLDTAGNYTLGESATGSLTGPASASFTVVPAAANHLTFGVQPGKSVAGVAISPAVTVKAFDPFGNLATNDNSDQVTLAAAGGPGGFASGSTITVTVSGGVATFSNLVLDTAGSYALGESGSGGLSGPASAGFTVVPAAANHLAFGIQPSGTTAGVAIKPAVTVKAFDQFDNFASNDNTDKVTLVVASGPGGFTGGSITTVTVSGGVATFSNLVLDTAGSYALSESATGGVTGPASASFAVVPAAANHLAFGVAPSGTVAGVAFSLAVDVMDKYGNLVNADNGDQVTLTVATGPGGFAPGSTTTAPVSGGVATFSNLVLDTAGNYTLGESATSGLTGPNSASFTVVPAAASHLTFGVQPGKSVAGAAISPAVTVKAFDPFGNLATNDNSDQVTLAVASGPGGFTGGSTTTVTVSRGVATFGNLVLTAAGSYTLGESATGGLTGPNSAGFTVSPAAADHLAFSVQPSTVVAGVAVNPAVKVQVRDRFGNLLTGDNSDKVTLKIASGPGSFASGSTITVTVSGGVATFSKLVLDTAGSYTLGDSATGSLTGPNSASFTVNPAAANHLAFSVQPSVTTAGVAIGPAVTVQVLDRFGNVVTSDNSDKVTLKIASGPGGFASGSTTTATVSGGVATFSNLVLDTAGSYTLGESASGGLTGPNSASFTVVPAAANHLAFGIQPSNSVAGVAIKPAVTVKVFDQFGNLATNDNSDQVTLSVASGPGDFSSGSTTTVTVSGGVATFSNLVLTALGTYTLSTDANGDLIGPDSASFTVKS